MSLTKWNGVHLLAPLILRSGRRRHFAVLQHVGDGGGENFTRLLDALIGGLAIIPHLWHFKTAAVVVAVFRVKDDLVGVGDVARVIKKAAKFLKRINETTSKKQRDMDRQSNRWEAEFLSTVNKANHS